MEVIQGKTLHNGSLQIDDCTFVDCTFINCTLEYSGRPVHFERTQLRGCRYIFFGQAKCTVQFLQCTGLLLDPSDWGEAPQEVVN